jgi:hypothetical protein
MQEVGLNYSRNLRVAKRLVSTTADKRLVILQILNSSQKAGLNNSKTISSHETAWSQLL